MKRTIWVSFGRLPSGLWVTSSAHGITWRVSSPRLVWLQGVLGMLDKAFSNSSFTVKGRFELTRGHWTPYLELYCNLTSLYRQGFGAEHIYLPPRKGIWHPVSSTKSAWNLRATCSSMLNSGLGLQSSKWGPNCRRIGSVGAGRPTDFFISVTKIISEICLCLTYEDTASKSRLHLNVI